MGIYPGRSVKPEGLWIHACSVGEVESVLPLIRSLQEQLDDHSLLVTTITPTGAARIKAEFGSSVQHAYLPLDSPLSVYAFLSRFKPKRAVIVEKEIWPVLFLACQHKKINLVLVNAMVSEHSFVRYCRWNCIFNPVFQAVSNVFAQSRKDASRFERLGVSSDHIHVAGNLKFQKQIPVDLQNQAKQLKQQLFGDRLIFIAGSTHDNEEALILQSLRQSILSFNDLVIILAPRHPQRCADITRVCQENGLSEVIRSSAQPMPCDQSVFILDTLGELFLFYAMADVAFVGGSLVDIGCHNLLEPAMLGVPVLFGPSIGNVENIAKDLVNQHAAIQIMDADQLNHELHRLLHDQRKRMELGNRAKEYVDSHHAASKKTVDTICSTLN